MMKPLDTRELGMFVKRRMNSDDCCHDFLHTREWLAEQGWSEEQITAWIAAQGIGCDCETINTFYMKPGDL